MGRARFRRDRRPRGVQGGSDMMETLAKVDLADYKRCSIQANWTRMCASCWRASVEDLSAEDLRELVRTYPPARLAAEFWGPLPAEGGPPRARANLARTGDH